MSNYTEKDLKGKSVADLKAICEELKIDLPAKCLKGDLINLILNAPKAEEKVEEVKKPEEKKEEVKPTSKKKGGFIVPTKAEGFKPIVVGASRNSVAQSEEEKIEKKEDAKSEVIREGFLEINQQEGYGFIRATYDGFSDKDAYVHQSKIKMQE